MVVAELLERGKSGGLLLYLLHLLLPPLPDGQLPAGRLLFLLQFAHILRPRAHLRLHLLLQLQSLPTLHLFQDKERLNIVFLFFFAPLPCSLEMEKDENSGRKRTDDVEVARLCSVCVEKAESSIASRFLIISEISKHRKLRRK